MKNKEDTIFMAIVIAATILLAGALGIAQYRINLRDATIEELERKVNVLECENIENESDTNNVSDLEKENDELKKEVKELEEDKTELQDKITELQKVIDEKQSYINYLYKELN